jgi:hypothetical protein
MSLSLPGKIATMAGFLVFRAQLMWLKTHHGLLPELIYV